MTAQDAHSGRTAPAEGTDMDAAIEAVQNVLVAYNVRFAISREIAEAAVRAAVEVDAPPPIDPEMLREMASRQQNYEPDWTPIDGPSLARCACGIAHGVPPLEFAARKAIADQFRTALLDGLDQLERVRHWNGHIDSGDLAQLIEAVAAEVGRS